MRTLEVYISGTGITNTTYATINEAMEAMRALHNAGRSPILHIITRHYARGHRFKDTFTTTDKAYFYNRLNQLDSLEARSYSYNGKCERSYSSYWHKDKLARILGA